MTTALGVFMTNGYPTVSTATYMSFHFAYSLHKRCNCFLQVLKMWLKHVDDSSISTAISLSVSVGIKSVVPAAVAKAMTSGIGALDGESY